MSLRLTLTNPPPLRLDLRGITPAALAGLGPDAIAALPLGHGPRTLPLGDCFRVDGSLDDDEDVLVLAGDLSRVDRIGWQLGAGRMIVDGPAGDHAGGCLAGGSLRVIGSAGLLAGVEMAGGLLRIEGDAGDFAAGTLPGSMDGMRGGTLVVTGRVGARFADRMRRGTAVVFGDAGDFLGARMVAGTVALGGRAGAHAGYGMRRGSLVFAGPAPALAPTFVPGHGDVAVFWQLLARDLARLGGPFAALPGAAIERRLGDLAADGKGELILAGA